MKPSFSLTLCSPTQDSRDTCCHQFPSYPERSTLIQTGKTFLRKDQFLEAMNRLSSKKYLPCSEAGGDVGNIPSTCSQAWSRGPRVFSYHQRLQNTRLRGFQELEWAKSLGVIDRERLWCTSVITLETSHTPNLWLMRPMLSCVSGKWGEVCSEVHTQRIWNYRAHESRTWSIAGSGLLARHCAKGRQMTAWEIHIYFT